MYDFYIMTLDIHTYMQNMKLTEYMKWRLVNTKIQMRFQKDFDFNVPSLAWPSKGERVESIKFFMW